MPRRRYLSRADRLDEELAELDVRVAEVEARKRALLPQLFDLVDAELSFVESIRDEARKLDEKEELMQDIEARLRKDLDKFRKKLEDKKTPKEDLDKERDEILVRTAALLIVIVKKIKEMQKKIEK